MAGSQERPENLVWFLISCQSFGPFGNCLSSFLPEKRQTLAENHQKSLRFNLFLKLIICYNRPMEKQNQNQQSQKQPAVAKKLGHRTPDRFRRKVFRRNPALNTNVRSFGGHR